MGGTTTGGGANTRNRTMANHNWRADCKASSSQLSCSPILEPLEPRLLLSNTPFLDTSPFENGLTLMDASASEWLSGAGGYVYNYDIDELRAGHFEQLATSIAGGIGKTDVHVLHGIWSDIEATATGWHNVTLSGNASATIRTLVGNIPITPSWQGTDYEILVTGSVSSIAA